MSNKKLSPKAQAFVDEYIIDFNATQAAIRAGYSEKTAYSIASENLRKPEIQEAIQQAIQKRSERTEITADAVPREFAVIGFADMRNYLKFSDSGDVYMDWSSMPEEATRAIAEITQEEYMEGKGDEARAVKRTRFKLHDKKGALDSMGKHLGMFIDKSINLNANMDDMKELTEMLRRYLTADERRAVARGEADAFAIMDAKFRVLPSGDDNGS